MKVRLFLIFYLIIFAFAQAEQIEIKTVNFWETDGCYALVSNDDYLFVGSNDRVYIFKFEDSHLQKVAECQIDYVVNALFVTENYLYVADMYVGLFIIDISKITQPKLVSYYCTPGTPRDVWVNGHYAYLAVDKYGLEVIDISNPITPKKVSRIPTAGKTWAVTGNNDYLFTANYFADLQIFSLSSPTHPQMLAHVSNLEGIGLGLYLNWPYLYHAIGDYGMQILDISNPNEPKFLGRCQPSRQTKEIFTREIIVIDNYAFITDMAGLQIVDVDNPQRPKQLAYNYMMGDGIVVSLVVRPTENSNEFLVYTSLGGAGFKILRVKTGGS